MPMIEANVPVMFDMKTVAKILSVSRSTVYQLLKSGELKAVRVGRVRRVSQNQLVEYIMKLEEKEDNWLLADYNSDPNTNDICIGGDLVLITVNSKFYWADHQERQRTELVANSGEVACRARVGRNLLCEFTAVAP